MGCKQAHVHLANIDGELSQKHVEIHMETKQAIACTCEIQWETMTSTKKKSIEKLNHEPTSSGPLFLALYRVKIDQIFMLI